MSEYWLIPLAFLTSTLAGVFGMGGGVPLIAVMPGLVPAAAIIPLHAVTQLASNLSRAWFGRAHVDYSLVGPFLLGAIAGAGLGGSIFSRLNLDWLPALIGVLILILTWLPLPKPGGNGNWALAALGFYQTAIGMVVGASGPLGAAVLARRDTRRDWLVVNTAVYMSVNHVVRMLAFAVMGFVFTPYIGLLAGMVAGTILGSWCGTALRRYIPEINFLFWFRCLVTVLAVRMIVLTLWN